MADEWSQYARKPEAAQDEWTQYARPSEGTPPESKGFLGELWDEVKSGPANLSQVGHSINQAVTHPYQTAVSLGQPMMDTVHRAKEKWGKGDYVGAAADALNTGINAVVPGLGSSSSDAGEMFSRGDYAGGAGKTLGIGVNTALGVKAPQVVKGGANAVAETVTPGVKGPLGRAVTADPYVTSRRALRPVPSDPEFRGADPETFKAIRDANAGEAPTGITKGEVDLIGATNKAITEHQAVLDKWLARAKGVRVNGDELVAATRKAIPDIMWQRDPGGAQALIDDAQRAFGGKTYTVDQFRQFLKSENGDLSAFYRRAPNAQADAAVAGTPPAIQAAQTGAIRDTLYKALDPEGNGAGPRTIQNKTSQLYDIRNAALRRNNAIVAEQPPSPLEKMIDPLKKAIPGFLKKGASGTGLAYAEGSEGRSIPNLKRTFNAVGDDPRNVLPEPGSPLYPTGNPTKLLTGANVPGNRPSMQGGTMYTPPPADTSFVRGAQGMYPTGPDPNRALPPGGSGPFTVGTPGMTPGRVAAGGLRGGRGVTVPDTSGDQSITGKFPVPQADSSVIPPGKTGRVIDMATQPAPHGAGADAEWWAKQPLTQPEIQARYQELFNKAENLSPQRPVTPPATGTPEVVTRGVDARENIARQVLKGKSLDQATPTERNVIDQLVSEGYGSAPPRFAHGGIIQRPTLLVDSATKEITGTMAEQGPEAIMPLSHIRMMGPQAQRHLLKGIGVHLGIGKRHSMRPTLGMQVGGKGQFGRSQENQ